MSTELSIRTIAQSDYPTWNQFVADSPSGSVYALSTYLDVLCSATNSKFSIVGLFKGSELVGGMPLYLSRFGPGWIAANRLLLYYHSPVIREYSTKVPYERTSRQLAIMQTLESHLRAFDCLHLLLHVRHPIEDARAFLSKGWDVRPNYSYVVDIADLQSAWGRVHQNLRRLIDRATTSGLTVTDDDDFDSFYRLHIDTHRRKGAPLYLKEPAFRRYVQALKAQDLCRLYHARLPTGESVATQLVLTGGHPVSHTVCAGADSAHLTLGSSPFLRWKAFESLSALGYSGNDLTDAALNDVTRFKAQLGGELVQNWVATRPGNRLFKLYRVTRQTTRRTKSALRRLR
ncbi:GNAT family N-acetyltransferase [Thiocapsa marina]|uniref:BioF2-like acetyltransferase domain-containing protein n=1 Tax=Thiocapsa marina 5811 TaxID=768671 RepID=F9UCM1_9GAMM|nr:GNAT family N-acetyltransferase [Thiocapsa marina]EGV18134.1 hypothetical protein ThimaDRAFT_2673 [Thiocapsa marina 5811]